MRIFKIAILLTVALAVVGCNRSASSLRPNTRAEPERLPAAPVKPVKKAELPAAKPKPVEEKVVEAPTAPETPEVPVEEKEVASIENPKPSSPPEKITREGMTGTWNVNSDNPDCRIILAFTKWAGGYRAASRKCQSTEIAAVTAWDVKGQQVVLVDVAGNTVARLYSSGGTRYDGTTNGGKPISFTR